MAKIQHTDATGNTIVSYTGSIDDAIAECLAALDAQVTAQKFVPVTYPDAGVGLFVHDAARADIGSMVTDAIIAKADGSWNAAFAWTMADGSYFTLATPDDMIALGKFAMGAYQALLNRAATARAAINGASHPADAYAVTF